MKDKVSIITPCYNSARFISKTIESVLNQTYPYWEMIIVDDCSHDNTKEVVEPEFFSKHKSRILESSLQYCSTTSFVLSCEQSSTIIISQ